MKKIYGFTLAEVLITLGIIGVVAALTMPSLIANYQKQAYVAQLKKSVSVLENGFKKVLADDGVDNLSDSGLWSTFSSEWGYGVQNEEFTSYLKKYFNVIETGKVDLKDYKHLSGSMLGTPEYRTSYTMSDGSYFMFMNLYKNPNSLSFENCNKAKALGGTLCEVAINLLYIDVNGDKAPNQFGRDLFQYKVSNDGRLLPTGGKDAALFENQVDLSSNSSYWKSSSAGSNFKCEKESHGYACAARIVENGWTMDY